MPPRAIPLLALVTALCAACNGRSSQNASAAAAPAPTHEHSSGSERGCPHLQAYSEQLDEQQRDEWQRPEGVIELLECRVGMTVVDLGAGTGYFLRYLSEAVGREGHVLALDISRSSINWMSSRIEREGLPNVRPEMVAPDDPGLSPRSVDRILVAGSPSTRGSIADRRFHDRQPRGASAADAAHLRYSHARARRSWLCGGGGPGGASLPLRDRWPRALAQLTARRIAWLSLEPTSVVSISIRLRCVRRCVAKDARAGSEIQSRRR